MKADVRREVEVDTALAELWKEAAAARARLDMFKRDLASALGVRGTYVRKLYTISESLDVLLAMSTEHVKPWDMRNYERAVEKIAETRAELARNREQAEPLEAEYAAEQWSRFFLVTNSNGHIHASMKCSTCRITTQFAWLPELSGLTEKDAVEAHGPHLCSMCFPTAPIEWRASEPAADPDQCPGSGTHDMVEGSHRTTGWSGNGRAICSHCGQSVGTTSTYKIRKHKKAEVAV